MHPIKAEDTDKINKLLKEREVALKKMKFSVIALIDQDLIDLNYDMKELIG